MPAPRPPTAFARNLTARRILRAVYWAAILRVAAACGPAEVHRAGIALRTDLTGAEHRALAERFRRAVERIVASDSLPGAVAAYALPTGRIGIASAGFADVESGARMGPHHRMPAGSIGKTFVAATVLSVAQQGLVELDHPVATYLGGPPYTELPAFERITIRQLLTHSSGLVDHVRDEDFGALVAGLLSAGDADETVAPPELVRAIADNEGLFPPGEGYAYTDTGYVLLGLVVEAITGMSYYDALRDRLLEPLGLEQTTRSARSVPYLATGYLQPANPFGLPRRIAEAGTMVINPEIEYTGGGLISNAGDLAAWARLLYRGDALASPYVEEVIGSAVPRSPDGPGEYGLGVFIDDLELGRAYGHGGWFPGYESVVAYFPDFDLAVAMQVNRDFGNRMAAYRDELAALVLSALAPAAGP